MKSISLLKEQKYHTTILLCLIISVAAFLRLYSLSTPSYSSDDIKSLEKIEKARVGDLAKDAAKRGHPAFYFIVLHYWMLMAGSSEFALRLPSAIFGIISVFVLFKLASLIFNNKTALIGAFLLAVNPEHFFASYALKQYTLTVLLGLTSIYLLLRALKGRNAIPWIAFCISNVVLLYTHKSAIFVVLTETFYIAIVFRKYKYSWQIFSSIGIVFILVVTLFFLQKRHTQMFSEPGWIATPTVETFLNVLSSFIAGFYIKMPEESIIFADNVHFNSQGPCIDALPMPAKLSILAFFSLLLLLGILKYFWNGKQSNPQISSTGNYKSLIYIWGTVPIISAYATSFLFWPVFGPTRYQLFWSCSVLLLLAKGLTSIGKLRFVYTILFIAVCIHLFPIITQESNPRGLNWKGVANYLRETVSDGETVHFLSNDFASLPIKYYYKEDIYSGIGTVFKKIAPNIRGGWSKGVFLIEAGESALPEGFIKNLDMFYSKKDVKQFHHISVTHYWKSKLLSSN